MLRPNLRQPDSRRSLMSRRHPPASIELLERRTLLSAAADPLQILVGGGAAKAVQFTDPGGTQAIVILSGPGTATVSFNGTGLTQSGNARGVIVNGSGVTLATITTRGRRGISAGGIAVAGSLSAIRAPGVAVAGDISTSGWVHQIQLGSAQDGTISVNAPRGGGGTLLLSVGSASNESVVSGVRIDSLQAGQWVNTTTAQSIHAPQIVNLNVKGAFAPNLSLSGTPSVLALKNFRAGSISGGTWSIGGNVGAIAAGSIAHGWVANVTGSANSITVSHDAAVNVTASTLGNVNVRGSLFGSSIQLLNPLTPMGFDLKSLSVGGAIQSSTIRSTGSIGAINAAQILSSRIYAGLVPLPMGQTLPMNVLDFGNVAQIKSVTLRRSSGASFAGSDIAAYSVGPVNLHTVQMSNGGTTFGIGAHSVKLVALTDQLTGKSVRVANVPSAAAFNSALASKGITPQDFVVSIV
jgi:hypothetical protein